MKILAVMFKVFLLSLGLVMIAGGLFCSAIGLESNSYGIVAVIGAASAVLGALFFYLAIRGLKGQPAAPEEPPQR
jgi:hypothetical protein